jgi:hypothetical protein
VRPEGGGAANLTASPVPERRHPIGDQRFGDSDVKRERTNPPEHLALAPAEFVRTPRQHIGSEARKELLQIEGREMEMNSPWPAPIHRAVSRAVQSTHLARTEASKRNNGVPAVTCSPRRYGLFVTLRCRPSRTGTSPK